MDGFAKLIDAMGGIRIKAGGWVPISGDDGGRGQRHPRHAASAGFRPANSTLDGYHALWYGRSREFVDDYARIQRQQCVQQAMLKQLDPATLLAKFEDIAKAGTKVVDSNISAGQLGSFVDLAMKAKGQEVEPADHRAARLRRVLLHGPGLRPDPPEGRRHSSAARPRGWRRRGRHPSSRIAAPGPLSAAGGTPPAHSPAPSRAPSPSDFTPVTTTPDGEPITEEMLNQFKRNGDEQSIRNLVATNGQCAPL